MNISEELKELQTLLQNGTLTQDEFQIAKRRILEGPTIGHSTAGDSTAQLEDLRIQCELIQLDREWDLVRDECMTPNRYGGKIVPNRFGAVAAAFFMVATGLAVLYFIFTSPKSEQSQLSVLLYFGAFYICFALWLGRKEYLKATRYHTEQERYLSRRKQLLEQRQRTQA